LSYAAKDISLKSALKKIFLLRTEVNRIHWAIVKLYSDCKFTLTVRFLKWCTIGLAAVLEIYIVQPTALAQLKNYR